MILHLICDNSGSMMEGGKALAMRTLVMTVAQWVRLEEATTQIKLYSWASEIQAFPNWSDKDEFPVELLSGSGRCMGKALIQTLEESPDGKILILTDGFWPLLDARALNRWKESLTADKLRFIKIGADPHLQLKGADVFSSEELFASLDGWLEGGSEV